MAATNLANKITSACALASCCHEQILEYIEQTSHSEVCLKRFFSKVSSFRCMQAVKGLDLPLNSELVLVRFFRLSSLKKLHVHQLKSLKRKLITLILFITKQKKKRHQIYQIFKRRRATNFAKNNSFRSRHRQLLSWQFS